MPPVPSPPSESARALTPATSRRRPSAALLAVLGALTLSGGATVVAPPTAAAATTTSPSTIAAGQAALGVEADGVVGPVTRRAVRRFQRREDLRVTGRLDRRTLAALGVSARASSEAPAGAASPALERIAACESGGDPTAVSADGQYRGKYQFSRATWEAMGGSGDPAAAPEGVQDEIAARLYAEQGAAPWPNCA